MDHYREPPAGTPLIWATRSAVFAIEPSSGQLRWSCPVDHTQRIFLAGERLFAATRTGVTCIAMETGQIIGVAPLEFVPTAGIAAGQHLFLAGPAGAAGLTADGEVMWSIKQEIEKGFSMKQHLVCSAHGGAELWRRETAGSSRFDNPGLLLGERVAQPDLDSNR